MSRPSMFHDLNRFLLSLTKFYQVLPSFTKFYVVLLVLPTFIVDFWPKCKVYLVLPSFTKFYQVLPSFT